MNTGESFAAGLALHQAGDYRAAEAIYREVLTQDPSHADALHLLGVLAAEAGQPDQATALIGRAIRLQGPVPLLCVNLGVAFSRAGKWREAVACYCQALKLAPGDAKTWTKLGKALIPLDGAAEARAAFETAVSLDPGQAEAHFELGNLLHRQGQVRESIASYRESLRLCPENAEAHFNLGVSLAHEKDVAGAIASYQEAIRLCPEHARAHNNLGTLLQAGGCVEYACRCYEEALRLAPDYCDARYNLGVALQELDREEEALEAYRLVLERKPDHAEAHNNRGNALLALGRPREALEAYAAALKINAEHAEARWNTGVVQLLLGDFESGWEGYEWRLKQRERAPREFAQPRWDGSPLEGRRILLHAEQGLGDTIQFIRYTPLVKQRGGVVLVEAKPSLARLLRGADGIDEVVVTGSALPEFDCHLPLMSLPLIFQTTLDTIPRRVPYLGCAWRQLPSAEERLRVGIVWAGNPKHKNDRRRSIAPEALRPLAEVPGVTLFSLQKGAALPPGFPAVSLEEQMEDFAETAGAILNLDLVISVDTSVAHLAGALAAPVWTLLPFVPDWRWLWEGEASPWYPTMRLFRQPERGDWKAVIERVREELRRLAESRA